MTASAFSHKMGTRALVTMDVGLEDFSVLVPQLFNLRGLDFQEKGEECDASAARKKEKEYPLKE